MSVFRMIKRGRQAAKEHKAQKQEEEAKESNKPIYRHVPTHAASDALAGAPPSWRSHEDRDRIIDMNRRRSAMTASGVGMTFGMSPVHMAGMPRVNSSLSCVSYPVESANPVVQHRLPRSYSYMGGLTPGWSEQPPTPSSFVSVKGKEVERLPSAADVSGRQSRSSSKGGTSPVDSSSNSTSSSDEMEMRPSKRVAAPPPAAYWNVVKQPPSEGPHRLHPAQHRRISDPQLAVSSQIQSQSLTQYRQQHQQPRPDVPRSMTLPVMQREDVPPVPALPLAAQHMASGRSPSAMSGSLHSSTQSTASSSAATATSAATVASSATTVSTNFLDTFNFDTPKPQEASYAPSREFSLAPLTAPGTRVSRTTPASPTAAAITTTTITAPPLNPKSPARASRNPPQLSRYSSQQLQTIDSHASSATTTTQRPATLTRTPTESSMRSTYTTATATPISPITFDRRNLSNPAPAPVVEAPPPVRTGKLTKNPAAGGKLVKKNRWSTRGNPNTAVAF